MTDPEKPFKVPGSVSSHNHSVVNEANPPTADKQNDFIVPDTVIESLSSGLGRISIADDLLSSTVSKPQPEESEFIISGEVSEILGKGLNEAIQKWSSIDHFSFETPAASPPSSIKELNEMHPCLTDELTAMAEFYQQMVKSDYRVYSPIKGVGAVSVSRPLSEFLKIQLIPWGWFKEQLRKNNGSIDLYYATVEMMGANSRRALDIVRHINKEDSDEVHYWYDWAGDKLENYLDGKIQREGNWGVRYLQVGAPGIYKNGNIEKSPTSVRAKNEADLFNNLLLIDEKRKGLGGCGVFEALAMEVQHNFPGYISKDEVFAPNRVKALVDNRSRKMFTRTKDYQSRLISSSSTDPGIDGWLIHNLMRIQQTQ